MHTKWTSAIHFILITCTKVKETFFCTFANVINMLILWHINTPISNSVKFVNKSKLIKMILECNIVIKN